MTRRRFRILLAVAVLGLSGAARLPFEDRLARQMLEDGVHEAPLDAGLREQLPQLGFMAALGGLRSLAASILDLKAHIAFEENDWGANEKLYDVITTLQPGQESYWDLGSWHRIRNAAGHYRYRSPEMSEEARGLRADYYVDSGIALLERSLKHHPESSRLHGALADAFTTISGYPGRPDGYRAIEHFLKAYEHSGREYFERSAGYELSKLPDPDRKKRAYEILMRHFRHFADDNLPIPKTLADTIQRLEEELAVPEMKRIRLFTAPDKDIHDPARRVRDRLQK